MAKYGTFKYGTGQTYGAGVLTRAGRTHHVVMDGVGLMLSSPIITKSDITSAVPRVSVGTDQKRHTDFSERDTWGQHSYHHGQGAYEIEDQFTFFDSGNIATWVSNQLTLMPAFYTTAVAAGGSDIGGRVASMLAFEGNLYVLVFGDTAADNELYVYNNGDDDLDNLTSASGLDTSTGEPKDLHPFDGNMYVAQGETVNARRFTGSSWSSNDVPANFYESYDGNLWRADNIFELYYSVDPHLDSGATWGGPVEVGDATYPIRGMVAGFDGALWVGKDDGIYSVRPNNDFTGYVATRVINLDSSIHETNGKAMIEYGGLLYISVGVGLIRYDGSSVQLMGPDRGAHPTERFINAQNNFGQLVLPSSVDMLPPTYQSGVVGSISSLAHDNEFLYAAVDNEGTSNSRVMLWTGTGWHNVAKSPSGQRITFVHFTRPLAATGEMQYPQLWFDNSTGDILQHQRQSKYSHNPLDEADMEYVPSGTLTTAWWDAGLRDIDKTIFDIVMAANNLSSSTNGNKITIEFQVDEYPVWYELGEIIHGPDQTLYFPINDDLDPGITCRKIRYRFTLEQNTSDSTTTPIVKSWGHRFVVRPESRYGWNINVKAYDEFHNLRRVRVDEQAVATRRFLYGLRDKKTPIQFFDSTELQPLTNIVTNPSFEVDSDGDGLADGYGSFGDITTSRSAQFKTTGVLSQHVEIAASSGEDAGIMAVFPGAGSGGEKVYVAADIFLEEGGDPLTLQLIDGQGILRGIENVDVNNAECGVASADGTHLFVASGAVSSIITSIDITTVGGATVVDTIDVGGTQGFRDMDIHPSGNYIFVTSNSSDTLFIINVSDPTNMTLEGSITDATDLDSAGGLCVDPAGDYVYVACFQGENRLTVVDITTIGTPSIAGSVTDASDLDMGSGSAYLPSVSADGDYVYLGTDSGFTIIDVSTPGTPAIEATLNTMGDLGTGECETNGTLVYVVGGVGGDTLYVIDASTPAAPTIEAEVSIPFNADCVAMSDNGSYLYVGSDHDNLAVFSITNADAPTFMYDTQNDAHDIVTTGDYVFLMSNNNDIVVVRTQNPIILAEETIYPTELQVIYGSRWARPFIFIDGPAAGFGNYTVRIIRKVEDGDSATNFYVDSLEFIIENPNIFEHPNGDYIDGDQLRCRWNGTPHASTSTRQEGYYVYITTFTESLRYLEARAERADYSSEIQISLREMQ